MSSRQHGASKQQQQLPSAGRAGSLSAVPPPPTTNSHYHSQQQQQQHHQQPLSSSLTGATSNPQPSPYHTSSAAAQPSTTTATVSSLAGPSLLPRQAVAAAAAAAAASSSSSSASHVPPLFASAISVSEFDEIAPTPLGAFIPSRSSTSSSGSQNHRYIPLANGGGGGGGGGAGGGSAAAGCDDVGAVSTNTNTATTTTTAADVPGGTGSGAAGDPSSLPGHVSRVATVTVELRGKCLGDADVLSVIAALERALKLPATADCDPRVFFLSIDISENQLHCQGFRSIVNWVCSQKQRVRLRNLKCFKNCVGDEGALALARLIELQPSCSLEELHLSHNCISAEGALALFTAFARCRAPNGQWLYPRRDVAKNASLPTWARLEYNRIANPARLLERWEAETRELRNLPPQVPLVCYAERPHYPRNGPHCTPVRCARATATGNTALLHLYSYQHQTPPAQATVQPRPQLRLGKRGQGRQPRNGRTAIRKLSSSGGESPRSDGPGGIPPPPMPPAAAAAAAEMVAGASAAGAGTTLDGASSGSVAATAPPPPPTNQQQQQSTAPPPPPPPPLQSSSSSAAAVAAAAAQPDVLIPRSMPVVVPPPPSSAVSAVNGGGGCSASHSPVDGLPLYLILDADAFAAMRNSTAPFCFESLARLQSAGLIATGQQRGSNSGSPPDGSAAVIVLLLSSLEPAILRSLEGSAEVPAVAHLLSSGVIEPIEDGGTAETRPRLMLPQQTCLKAHSMGVSADALGVLDFAAVWGHHLRRVKQLPAPQAAPFTLFVTGSSAMLRYFSFLCAEQRWSEERLPPGNGGPPPGTIRGNLACLHVEQLNGLFASALPDITSFVRGESHSCLPLTARRFRLAVAAAAETGETTVESLDTELPPLRKQQPANTSAAAAAPLPATTVFCQRSSNGGGNANGGNGHSQMPLTPQWPAPGPPGAADWPMPAGGCAPWQQQLADVVALRRENETLRTQLQQALRMVEALSRPPPVASGGPGEVGALLAEVCAVWPSESYQHLPGQ